MSLRLPASSGNTDMCGCRKIRKASFTTVRRIKPPGLTPVIAVRMLVQVHKCLLHHIFRRSTVPDDRPGYRQQPPRMQPHRSLKELV